jgi:hypothetical protein
MTTTLETSCSENTMVLSARREFLHACIFKLFINTECWNWIWQDIAGSDNVSKGAFAPREITSLRVIFYRILRAWSINDTLC